MFLIDDEKQASKILVKQKFSHKIIPKEESREQADRIAKIMNFFSSRILLLDMREYGESLSKHLSKYDFKTVVIDDAWCKNVYADVIVNVTPVKQYHRYKKIRKKSKIYVGAKYFIADKKFLRYRKTSFRLRAPRIIISMGGSDPEDLTSFVVKSLLSISKIQATIILGPLYSHYNKIQNTIKNNDNFTIINKPKNIWLEFSKSDLAISNAGNTLFELAIMGIPTICMAAVKHQIPYAKIFAEKGFAKDLGYERKAAKKAILSTTLNLLHDELLRVKMSKAGSIIVDGKGLSRVVDVIEKTLFTE